MKFLTFQQNNELRVGVVTEQGVVPIEQTMDQVLQGGASLLQDIAGEVSRAQSFVQEFELKICPAVPAPGKIIGVGLNYRKHAKEANLEIPKSPILFNKFANAIAAHEDTIVLPAVSEQVDYEAELVIVIGKKAQHVKKEEALDYVFGYCAVNDLSARDLQFRTHQWLLGKSLDGFCPVGPYLVTADEVGNPNDLQIQCFVNGEERQNSTTADMIFHCDELVSYISDYMTLEPGDIILTGTPAGVIMGYPKDQQVWLKDGDVVSVEIEKLGRLTNTFKAE